MMLKSDAVRNPKSVGGPGSWGRTEGSRLYP